MRPLTRAWSQWQPCTRATLGERSDCFQSVPYIRQMKKFWLSRYFLCMNYSAPRRMLWFAIIMGGPEMARHPATPHIYFRPWQNLCHARSRKPATAVENDWFWVQVKTFSPFLAGKTSYCGTPPHSTFTNIKNKYWDNKHSLKIKPLQGAG